MRLRTCDECGENLAGKIAAAMTFSVTHFDGTVTTDDVIDLCEDCYAEAAAIAATQRAELHDQTCALLWPSKASESETVENEAKRPTEPPVSIVEDEWEIVTPTIRAVANHRWVVIVASSDHREGTLVGVTIRSRTKAQLESIGIVGSTPEAFSSVAPGTFQLARDVRVTPSSAIAISIVREGTDEEDVSASLWFVRNSAKSDTSA